MPRRVLSDLLAYVAPRVAPSKKKGKKTIEKPGKLPSYDNFRFLHRPKTTCPLWLQRNTRIQTERFLETPGGQVLAHLSKKNQPKTQNSPPCRKLEQKTMTFWPLAGARAAGAAWMAPRGWARAGRALRGWLAWRCAHSARLAHGMLAQTVV